MSPVTDEKLREYIENCRKNIRQHPERLEHWIEVNPVVLASIAEELLVCRSAPTANLLARMIEIQETEIRGHCAAMPDDDFSDALQAGFVSGVRRMVKRLAELTLESPAPSLEGFEEWLTITTSSHAKQHPNEAIEITQHCERVKRDIRDFRGVSQHHLPPSPSWLEKIGFNVTANADDKMIATASISATVHLLLEPDEKTLSWKPFIVSGEERADVGCICASRGDVIDLCMRVGTLPKTDASDTKASPQRLDLNEALDAILDLEDGWDGEGSIVPPPLVTGLARSYLLGLPDHDLPDHCEATASGQVRFSWDNPPREVKFP